MSYGGDINRGPFDLAINWTFVSISIVAVSLRLMSRKIPDKDKFDLGDYFLVLTLLVTIAKSIWITIAIHYGYGRQLPALLANSPETVPLVAKLSYTVNGLALWTWTLPKIPVVDLLVKIFGHRDRYIGWIFWSLIIFLCIWNAVLTVITYVQCNPVSKNWTPKEPGYCWNGNIYLDLGYFGTVYSATLDFTFAIYPTVRISGLQMPLSRKILTCSAMGLGIPAGIVTLIKASQIKELIENESPTWAPVPLDVWNSVESTALILAAAVPMTRPAAQLIFLNNGTGPTENERNGSTYSKNTTKEQATRRDVFERHQVTEA